MARVILEAIFGARGQLVVGILLTLIGIYIWLHYAFLATPTVATVFHISMLFGVAACYAIVATALGYRATERVEKHIVENADEVNIDVDC